MRILLTGATGFLGRQLVKHLLGRRHEIFAVTRPSATDRQTSALAAEVHRVPIDLSQPFETYELPQVEAVVTLAQEREFRDFPETAGRTMSVNVESNVRLWAWASQTGVTKVVHASSGGIYGSGTGLAFTEDTLPPPHAQNSFYLGTKLCAEIALRSFFPLFQSIVIVRPFFLYGPGQDPDKFVQRMITKVAIGNPIALGEPDGIRTNPIYIDDAARLFADALDLDRSLTVNCAGSEIVTLRSLCDEIGQCLGTEPVYIDSRSGTDDCIGETALQFQLFGTPKVGITEGIAAAVAATQHGGRRG